MTQPTFDGIPIADMYNVFLLKTETGRWKVGYVFNGEFYLHKLNLNGTYNKVRAEIVQYVNNNLPIPDWGIRWEHAPHNNMIDAEMFSYLTGLRVSTAEMLQSKAIALIKDQVVEESTQKISSDLTSVLSKSDEEILADIAAGVIKERPAGGNITDLTRVTSKPKIVDTLSVETEEPPIMAAGALADAGLLNQNIGLPSDLLRAAQWPAYWKFIPAGWSAIDTYRIGALFPVEDPSGRIIHARKKLLVPGVRTGGKSMFKDIKEARDTLTQWLEDNPE